jgi:hypothetical protein
MRLSAASRRLTISSSPYLLSSSFDMTFPKKIHPPSSARLRREFNAYFREVGSLVNAWNDLQENLASIFWKVTGINNRHVAFGIWHSTPSDLAQRKMLRAAIEASYPAASGIRTELIWLLDKVDHSLSGKRNDGLHGPIILLSDKNGMRLSPQLTTNNPRAKGFVDKDVIETIEWYRLTAEALRRHSYRIKQALQAHDPSLPDRPELPLLSPQLKAKKTPRAMPRKARKRQHQPSQT